MRKVVALVVCGLLVAPIAFAQTNVYSQNAVGYVKVTINKGELALLRNDFVDIDGNPQTIKEIVGDQLPQNSVAYIWDRVGGAYITELKGPRGWPGTGTVIERGDAFFLQAAPDAAEASYDVFMLGEVPDDDDFTVASVETAAAGYPYPAATSWTGTVLSATADVLHTWDSVAQSYSTVVKGPRGWGATGNAIILEPGEGFWVESATSVDWQEVKPYDWP